MSTADKGHCGGSYCGGLTYARVYAYVEPIWMCAPDRSRTLSSHRRGIRADPWATRCIFIRRRKRSLRLRIFPVRYVLSRLFILCNFAGFRVYYRRSAGVESLRREHRACDVDSKPTGTRTTTTMYPMACRFFELSSKTQYKVLCKVKYRVQRFVASFRTIPKRNVSR